MPTAGISQKIMFQTYSISFICATDGTANEVTLLWHPGCLPVLVMAEYFWRSKSGSEVLCVSQWWALALAVYIII